MRPRLESVLTWFVPNRFNKFLDSQCVLCTEPLTVILRVTTLAGFLRRLGWFMSRANPTWRIKIDGARPQNPRNPYVVVSNHLALATYRLLAHCHGK